MPSPSFQFNLNLGSSSIEEAMTNARETLSNSEEGQLIKQSYIHKPRFKMQSTGSGDMRNFKEDVWISPEGKEVVKGTPAFQQAIQYSQEHPKEDASENIFNNLLAGGTGLFRSFGTGAAQNLIKTAQNWAPKLSFSSAYNNAAWTPYADAAFNAVFGIPSAYDIGTNGLNWENGTELGLSVLPAFGHIKLSSKKVKINDPDIKYNIESPTSNNTTSASNYNFDELLKNGTFKIDPNTGQVVYDVNFDFNEFLKYNPDFKPKSGLNYFETPSGSIVKSISDTFKQLYGIDFNHVGIKTQRGGVYIPFVGSNKIPNTVNMSDVNGYLNKVMIPRLKNWNLFSDDLVKAFKDSSKNTIFYRQVPTIYTNSKGINLRRLPNSKGIGGWHDLASNTNYIHLNSPISKEETLIHEVLSHASDPFISEGVQHRYKQLAQLLGDESFIPNSTKWYETRATRHQLEYRLRNLGYDTSNLESINKIPDNVILNELNNVNGYGRTYVSTYQKMNEDDKINTMKKLKYALTLPVAAGVLSTSQQEYKKGGSIRIKEKNKGKFTEYCGGKVTNECIQKAKKSDNPKLIKRAIFAQNVRKWNNKK